MSDIRKKEGIKARSDFKYKTVKMVGKNIKCTIFYIF